MDQGLARDVEVVERAAWSDLFAAAPEPFAENIGLGQARAGAALLLMAAKAPDTLFNRVFGFGVDQPTSEAELDAAIATMRAGAASRWWLQPSPAVPELARWAEARGFTPATRPWAKVARGPSPPAEIVTELRIEEIGEAEGEAFATTLCAGFDAPPHFGLWFRALIGRSAWRCYLAYGGRRPLAGAALYFAGDMAWLGVAATVPEGRRQGGQGALMARRIEDAIAAASRLIVTETGVPQVGEPSPSYNNMMRHGFSVVHLRPNLVPPPAT